MQRASPIDRTEPQRPAGTATWSDAGLALWKAWSSTLPYLALTTFVTVFAKSSAAGMAIGLGYYFAEQLIVALFSSLFSWFQNVADFFLVRNISGWVGGSGGLAGGALPASADGKSSYFAASFPAIRAT